MTSEINSKSNVHMGPIIERLMMNVQVSIVLIKHIFRVQFFFQSAGWFISNIALSLSITQSNIHGCLLSLCIFEWRWYITEDEAMEKEECFRTFILMDCMRVDLACVCSYSDWIQAIYIYFPSFLEFLFIIIIMIVINLQCSFSSFPVVLFGFSYNSNSDV